MEVIKWVLETHHETLPVTLLLQVVILIGPQGCGHGLLKTVIKFLFHPLLASTRGALHQLMFYQIVVS